MRVLLVEDERSLARMIEVELLLQNMAVEVRHDGKSGLAAALEGGYDLVILDWILPGAEGIDVCRALRERGSQVPIIIITAKQGVSAEVRGLEEGADDFIAKPFDVEQLLARIHAVTRRSARSARGPALLEHGRVSVDRDIRAVREDGERVHLTNKEYDILVLLLENRGRVVAKDEIRSAVWGCDIHLDEGAIAVHIKAIRDKLKGLEIENVRGVGYLVAGDQAGS